MKELETNGPDQAASKVAPRHERPIWIWDQTSARFLWANGPGIHFWEAASLEGLQNRTIEASHPAFVALNDLFQNETGVKRIELTLAFPNGSGVHHYPALCRSGILQDRPALIVELLTSSSGHALDLQETDKDLSVHQLQPAKMASTGHEEEADPSNNQDVRIAKADPEEDQISAPQLSELARLIQEAKHEEAEPKPAAQPEAKAHNYDSESVWDALSLDMTRLQGAHDQDEIEALLDGCDQPVALVHFHRIIHANEGFVSEFGYGDVMSLGNDGTDWILPQSRPQLRPFYDENKRDPLVIDTVRLCSGRTLVRPVYIRPVRLVKFERVFLLLTVGPVRQEQTQNVLHTKEGSLDLLQTDETGNIPFLSAISHEVRIPLNIIIGFSELMMREQFGALGHEKYKGYAQDIHQSALHALSLLNDLLDFTKLHSGKWEIEKVSLDLNEIVREQVHLMRDLAAREKVKLRSSLEENLPLITADKRALAQILLNLISNAIKFNHEQGTVSVVTELNETGEIKLEVTDTGNGMDKAELARAVEPFQQTGAAKNHIGTGLGLPIAHALAKANDFGFQIASEKGQGTRFTLLIKA